MNRFQEEIVIDLTTNEEQLNESFLRMFGSAIEMLFKRIFGLNNYNFKIKGSPSDVRTFADLVAKETSYLKSIKSHGLDDPSSFRSKSDLESAVKKFESATGIKWPFV